MSVGLRQAVERAIAKQTIADLLAAGCTIDVTADGESEYKGKDAATILAAMFQFDDCFLEVSGTQHGWVRFVFGNDGYDVISDYTINLEGILKDANALADRIEEGNVTIS